jgi:hypothetical protein
MKLKVVIQFQERKGPTLPTYPFYKQFFYSKNTVDVKTNTIS